MVRGELHLDRTELPEAQLRAVWQALDDDKSGDSRGMQTAPTLLAKTAPHAPLWRLGWVGLGSARADRNGTAGSAWPRRFTPQAT